MKKKYIRKISDYMIAGGIGALVIAGMQGCEKRSDENSLQQAAQVKGAFVIIEQSKDGGYKILEEYPSDVTRIIVRESNGNERILSKSEMDKLVKEEAIKIDNGTSPLTEPSMNRGVPGLGQVLMSSIAGAMIGSWIGNRLFNNQNYQSQRRTNYKTPQAYTKSTNSFNKARSSGVRSYSKKSGGFFGTRSTTRSRSLFGFGG